MATVTGGLFHAVAHATPVAPASRPDAGPLGLASITNHAMAGGGADSIAGGATSGGGSNTAGSGFDTVSGAQGDVRFAGNAPAGSEQVVATQTVEGGNTILHLQDGSTLTLIGITHADITFIH
jgi:hypothetical protein